ncbi:dTDP-4-amino-4,6-dideoxygalactose transaminase [Cohnella endophytica]|uniref:dTDP-4-amino-4,6-dideoxygalactose transaminase n=1 Tax=Cohnella endophytica TaxID=2419778 RepID=A0A494XW52_9BACL|nr:dTDP-4-amino-4,6-dideoxygalactose transaminase [Cohnella endophytica]RKP53196.1 dTDP-4-amino-4,6-dideoxygalactose transaminase [Cohnella endophytica]
MIPFNRPAVTGKETTYIQEVVASRRLCGDGPFTKRCSEWLENYSQTRKALITTSCTHALEMTAILADIQPGDEVIMPSFTFVSTANAFVLRGAKIVFVDIRPDTLNLDETLIESAITPRTKAIVPVHYAGVSCEMDAIMDLANRYELKVIEDAAQCLMSTYKERPLGSIGHMGCFSFHETKNYNCGEGGALLLNETRFAGRAEIVREKGTNRSRFFRGQVDKYTWVDVGSSYLPSEMNAAYLMAQFDHADAINSDRLASWNRYYEGLRGLEEKGRITLPSIPNHCKHNSHLFYIKTRDLEERTDLLLYLKEKGISAAFHYVPLHSSPAGVSFGSFQGEDRFTTRESERLVRLPLYYQLRKDEADQVIDSIYSYYESN